jgi:GR25 family glycosyltransferase involved in LPS biosynthesis
MNSIKTIIINLERRKDRWQEMRQELSKVSCLDYQFFKAIDGQDILPIYNKALDTPNKHACLLSHKKAIQQAKENDYEQVLILEDDIEFCHDFDKKFNIYYNSLPKDWGIAYLSYAVTPAINHLFPEASLIKDNIYKMNGSLGAWAYLVNNSMYDILINEFDREKNFTDNILAEIQKRHNCYCYKPFLVCPKNGVSDTSEAYVEWQDTRKEFLT